MTSRLHTRLPASLRTKTYHSTLGMDKQVRTAHHCHCNPTFDTHAHKLHLRVSHLHIQGVVTAPPHTRLACSRLHLTSSRASQCTHTGCRFAQEMLQQKTTTPRCPRHTNLDSVTTTILDMKSRFTKRATRVKHATYQAVTQLQTNACPPQFTSPHLSAAICPAPQT